MENGRKLFAKIREKGYDGAILYDGISRRWATGFAFDDGFVLVTERDTLMVTDSRFIEAARKQSAPDVRPVRADSPLVERVYEEIRAQGLTSLCFDGCRTTLQQFKNLKERTEGVRISDEPGLCEELRRVKNDREIQAVRTAQSITDAAFTHICGRLHPGMTELEVAAELEYFMRKNGADGIAFETIVVSGRNSSLPHGVPGNVALTPDSFLTMDFGARYDGYCSDMTRTVVLGKADDEMRFIYGTVLNAQKAAIASLRPGAVGKDVDAAARNIIKAAGYGEAFGHSTGHSLGLEIHEDPHASARSNDVFVPGEFLTAEPGIYLEGKYGVRIEDLLLVTPDGAEDLTKSDKRLLEIA